jgi:hypothetical protein
VGPRTAQTADLLAHLHARFRFIREDWGFLRRHPRARFSPTVTPHEDFFSLDGSFATGTDWSWCGESSVVLRVVSVRSDPSGTLTAALQHQNQPNTRTYRKHTVLTLLGHTLSCTSLLLPV